SKSRITQEEHRLNTLGYLTRANCSLRSIKRHTTIPRSFELTDIDPKVLVDNRKRHANQVEVHGIVSTFSDTSHAEFSRTHITRAFPFDLGNTHSVRNVISKTTFDEITDANQTMTCNLDNGVIELHP